MSGVDFLDKKLIGKVTAKRTSQQALAKVLSQSPTKTESDHVHGVNVTRFAELLKNNPAEFQYKLEHRVAWQVADKGQRADIMTAIRTV